MLVVVQVKADGSAGADGTVPSCERMLASDVPLLAAKFTGTPSCAASCSISAINACPD